MRELILVSLSALMGYIVFSAFSTSDTPQEAFSKIIDQPHENRQIYQEVASNKLQNTHEEQLIALENQRKLEHFQIYGKIEMHNSENKTKVELKKLDNELSHKLAVLKIESNGEDKNKDNSTLIVLALLLFLLLLIYLKYKKQLNEIELEKQERYNEMIARKEYSEKILAYMNEGNFSFETEKKLLLMLDELNSPKIKPLEKNDIYHPNPDIIQLSNVKKNKN